MSQYPPHFKRPLLLAAGFETRAPSTLKGNLVFSTGAAKIDHVQSLTGKSTGTEINNYGITKIIAVSGTESATAARWIYTLAAPETGVEKILLVQADTTETIQVRTGTSLLTFFGSTFNALEWSTNGASTMGPPIARLVGVSTDQWAVDVAGSTAGITQQGATA